MTTPDPSVPVERSLPEPEELAHELEAPEEAEDMAVGQQDGTIDQAEQP